MMKIRMVISVLILTFLFCFTAQGQEFDETNLIKTKEGFNLGTLADQFKTAWAATYQVCTDDSSPIEMGSAVLVFKKTQFETTYLGFLTAGHLLDRILRGRSGNIIRAQQATKVLVPNTLNDFADKVEWFTFDRSADLGFFIVKTKNAQSQYLRPAEFSPSCTYNVGSRVVVVGYPGTDIRPRKSQNVPIINPQNTLLRRWSEGLITSKTDLNDSQPSNGIPLIGSTADSLRGMSGGAVLNAQGELIGIHAAGRAGIRNEYRYMGSETDPSNLIPNQYFVSCNVAKSYAHQNWRIFLSQLGLSI